MSSERYGCGPFDRCVGSCISEGFNYCRCYDESDQEAYWADCCLEHSSDSRAGVSEAFLASGSKSPEKIWDDWADGATSNSTAILRAPVVYSAPKEWGDSGGLSEAFLAEGSKSPEKIWDDWADGATSNSTAIPRAPVVYSAPKEWGDSGGLSEAFLAEGSKSPEKIWDDWADGATSNSTAIPWAPVVYSAPKEWGDSGGLSEAFLAEGSKSPEKIWDDWADGATSNSTAIPRAPVVYSAPKEWGDSGGLSEAFLAEGSKSPEKIWDDWADGATSNSTAIPRAPVVYSAPKEWGDSGGLSEAFLAEGSKSPEKIWDDWADGATSNSTAIPRAPAVASAPKEWGDSGGSTSHSMSIPPSSTLIDVTLADGGRAFDCSACCLLLKPPIFVCDQGHAVCLPCLNSLKALSWEGSPGAARCNVSGGHHTDGYRRCKSLEDAVEAIRVTCPYAAYGCADLLTRYFLPTHRRSCSYAPTASCPRDDCSFIGSVEALLDHFISVEKWPYTAETQGGKGFGIHLLSGFNVVGAVRGTSQHLLVLFVARKTFGTTISAFCICPQPKDISWLRPPPKALKCKLELWFLSTQHDAITSFDVACTNPLDGFPDPDEFVQFFVPKSVHTDDNAAIRVTASITLFYPEA